MHHCVPHSWADVPSLLRLSGGETKAPADVRQTVTADSAPAAT